MREGKPVPPEVLADYPDLQKPPEGGTPENKPPTEPTPAAPQEKQKYRIGNNPTLYEQVEILPATATEKKMGEQPVRVRNTRTGEEQTVMESDLTPVHERTAEEKARPAASLDDQLRQAGLEPSVFQNNDQKRAALKRARELGASTRLRKMAGGGKRRATEEQAQIEERPVGEQPQRPRIELPPPKETNLENLEAVGTEDIRKLLDEPRVAEIVGDKTVALWKAFMNSPVARKLDAVPMRLRIQETIQQGEYRARGIRSVDPLGNFIRMAYNADERTLPHEMAHGIFDLLPKSDRDLFEQYRAKALETDKGAGDLMKEVLRKGDISSREFAETELPIELYHYSNASEFMADALSKRAEERFGNDTVWKQLVFRVRQIYRALANALRRVFRLRPDLTSKLDAILDGRVQLTPESGALYDREQAQLVSRKSELQQVSKNVDELSDEQNDLIARDVQAQNSWLKLPSVADVFKDLPQGVATKLRWLVGERADVLKGSEQGGVKPVSIDSIQNDPRLKPEQKMLILGDIVENNIQAESQIEKNWLKR